MTSTTDVTNTDMAKWWGNSLTIRGAILSAASAVFPVLGMLVGIDVSGDTVHQIGEQVIVVVQAVGGLAGMMMTVAGRMRAVAPITRRSVTLTI